MAPQDLKYKGEPTRLVIGNGNIFREFVTIHRGTVGGRGATTIGDRNYLMAYAHVAHDCLVGNDTILSHGTTLGGHVDVDDFATLGGYAGVHQFCRVGKYAFIGGFSAVHEGRAAVLEDGRQPRPDLRPQHASAWCGAASRPTPCAS